MTPQERKVMELALEALTHIHPSALTSFYTIGDRDKAIIAIKEALAQPEQEHDLQDTRCKCCGYMTYHREHMGCIRAAKPEQEPVAWWVTGPDGEIDWSDEPIQYKEQRPLEELVDGCGYTPLYTTPPQRTWVGLESEEIRKAKHHMVDGAYHYSFKQGAEWAEAKLEERNK